MTYRFKCDQCSFEEQKDIPMDDYSKVKDSQVCTKCGFHSSRVLEWNGGVKLCTGCYGLDSSNGNNWTTK